MTFPEEAEFWSGELYSKHPYLSFNARQFLEKWSFGCCCCFWHTRWCLEFLPESKCKYHLWKGLGVNMECQGSNTGKLPAKQTLYLLYFCSCLSFRFLTYWDNSTSAPESRTQEWDLGGTEKIYLYTAVVQYLSVPWTTLEQFVIQMEKNIKSALYLT